VRWVFAEGAAGGGSLGVEGRLIPGGPLSDSGGATVGEALGRGYCAAEGGSQGDAYKDSLERCTR
jgi:hypothetical protein